MFVFRETAFSAEYGPPRRLSRLIEPCGPLLAVGESQCRSKAGDAADLAQIWPFVCPFWVQFFLLGVFSARFRQKSRPVRLPAPRSRNVAEKAHSSSAFARPNQAHHPYWRPSTPEARYHHASTGPTERPGSSAVGSAPALGAGGRGFKSPLPDKETPGQKRYGGALAGSRDVPGALRTRSPAREYHAGGTCARGPFLMPKRRHFGSPRKLPSGRWQANDWNQGERHLAREPCAAKTGALTLLSTKEADILRRE